MAQTEKKSIGWGWIVFWWILFWPVGLVLTIIKLSSGNGSNSSIGGQAEQHNSAIEYENAKCPGCGALNKVIKGKSSTCEYCGVAIQGQTVTNEIPNNLKNSTTEAVAKKSKETFDISKKAFNGNDDNK